MRKWGDVAHWRFPVERLGTDEFGTWLGAVPPTPYTGPRGAGAWTHNFVMCIPSDAWWVATFNAYTTDLGARIYVDMTTVPVWLSDTHVQAIDLDLDVIRTWSDEVIIDDEDEFAEHQVLLRYPPEIVALAEASRDRVHAAILDERAPYDGSHEPWLRLLAESARDDSA
jgi:protein associated with RNAse G/E